MAGRVTPGGKHGSGRAASLVAVGILLSRIAGLVRERALAHYLGSSFAADAFRAAFRIPNLLQNLFGEGALSASFIPVYARLIAKGEREAAARVAGSVAALLALVISILVLIGVVATPWLIDLIAPGFTGERRALTITLVRVFFPGAGLLVLSAWCLGVLNSHGRFLLSYTAPVVWNAAIIGTLIIFGRRQDLSQLTITVAWGSVLGSALQFAVQLPSVLRCTGPLRLRPTLNDPDVRTVAQNFWPVFISRGVVQLSAYVDQFLASWLPAGSVALMGYAQNLAILPVSLFGASVSAAELPAMAGVVGAAHEVAAALRVRLDTGLQRIAYFIVPSAIGFVVLGDVMAAAIYRTGRFTVDRHPVGVGDHGGICGRTAGIDPGPSVLVGLLRASRHTDPASICRDPSRPDDGPWLSLRAAATTTAAHRSAVGDGRSQRIRGRGGVGRVRPAAPHAESAHWQNRRPNLGPGRAVDLCSGRRRGGVGGRSTSGHGSSDRSRDGGPSGVRRCLRGPHARVPGVRCLDAGPKRPSAAARGRRLRRGRVRARAVRKGERRKETKAGEKRV